MREGTSSTSNTLLEALEVRGKLDDEQICAVVLHYVR